MNPIVLSALLIEHLEGNQGEDERQEDRVGEKFNIYQALISEGLLIYAKLGFKKSKTTTYGILIDAKFPTHQERSCENLCW